ncbi:MAG TPA: hypothetical protein VN762_07370, partial [Steroidobacteraceae bacterium]|nr:hypothetical protein [Steroidobacteraceae bacterium]
MNTANIRRRGILVLGLVALGATSLPATAAAPATLLNASYDPTRELYIDYNAAFTKYWKAK